MAERERHFIISEADLREFVSQCSAATMTTLVTLYGFSVDSEGAEAIGQSQGDFFQQMAGWMNDREIGKGVELLPDADALLPPALRKVAVDSLYAAREDNKVMDQAAIIVAINVLRGADLAEVIREVAIPSLRYCEEKYGHDDQARLNLEAAIGEREGEVALPGPEESIRNQIIGYLRGRAAADQAEALEVENGNDANRLLANVAIFESAADALAATDEADTDPATGVGGST
jgi:hypothetical protein